MRHEPCIYCGHSKATHDEDATECNGYEVVVTIVETGKRTRYSQPGKASAAFFAAVRDLPNDATAYAYDGARAVEVKREQCGCCGWSDEPSEGELQAQAERGPYVPAEASLTVVTTIGLEQDKSAGGDKFSRIVPKLGARLDPEAAERAAQYADAMRPTFEAAPVVETAAAGGNGKKPPKEPVAAAPTPTED